MSNRNRVAKFKIEGLLTYDNFEAEGIPLWVFYNTMYQKLPYDTKVLRMYDDYVILTSSEFPDLLEGQIIPLVEEVWKKTGNYLMDNKVEAPTDGWLTEVNESLRSAYGYISDGEFKYSNTDGYYYCNYTPNYGIDLTVQFDVTPDPNNSVITARMLEETIECKHSWKEYIGLTNRYDFCSLCDVKK